MYSKKFEKELEMIENALDNEQSKDEFKEFMSPLVEAIAEAYHKNKKVKRVSKEKLIEAGWTHFDFALRKYKEKADLMMELKNDLFYFSTYFTWFVRQGIIEYLIREKIILGS